MKMMKSARKKLFPALSLLLSLLMAIYIFPADVAAMVSDFGEPAVEDPAVPEEKVDEDEGADPVDALFEMTELRSADTKYVKMSDGTVKALVYGSAVHRKDETGAWQDIDNSLTVTDDRIESERVSFYRVLDESGTLYTLADGEKRISVSLPGVQPGAEAEVLKDGKGDEKFDTKLEELSALTKLVSSLRYKNVLPSTDLTYTLHGNDLKEEIVLSEPTGVYSFTFALHLEGLCPILEEDGSISLFEEEQALYRIPAPYMYDAEGACSDAVSYTLEEADGEGEYLLTVFADEGWLGEEERVFPVTVDPTIDTVAEGFQNVFSDLYTNTKNAGLSYVNQYLYVGGEDYDLQKAYIQVNYFPVLPAGSIVNSVYMWYYECSSYLSQNRVMEMRKVEGRQTVAGITASTALQIGNRVEDYVFAEDFQNSAAETVYRFDITNLYGEWCSETTGHIVQLSLKNDETSDDHVILRSCRDTDVISPSLDITYVCDIGLEEQYSYRTQQIGGAGTGYISEHSGQLCLTFTDTVSDNTALPLSVSHVYNSQYAGLQRTETVNSVNLFANMKVGKGFMLSTQTSAIVNESCTAVKYTDGDGTVHDLTYAYTVNGSHYYHSDNNALTAVDASSQTLSSYPYSGTSSFTEGIILKDLQNNCMIYYKGLPVLYFDSNGNKVLYLYNTTSASGTSWFPTGNGQDQLRRIIQYNRLENGYSSSILAATMYYSAGALNRIITPQNTTFFEYDGGDRLVNVSVFQVEHNREQYEPTYTFNIAEYQYNGDGCLTSAYDPVGTYGVNYTVSDGKYVRYEEFAGTAALPSEGAAVDLSYEKGQTTVTIHGNGSDVEDRETVSVFDNCGRTVCSYALDRDGRLIGQTYGSYSSNADFSRNRLLEATSTGAVRDNLLANSSFEPLLYLSASDGWTRSDASVGSAQTLARTGVTSLLVVSTAQSEKSFAQAYTVHSSEEVCFSIYVNLSEVSETNGWIDLSVREGEDGAPVVKRYGSDSELFSALSSASEKRNVWRRLWIAAEVTNGQNYTFTVTVHGIVGSLYFDDAQLEFSDKPTVYNALSSREEQLDTRGWVASGMTALRPEDQGFIAPFGGAEYVYTAEGSYGTVQSIRQKVRGVPGKVYTLSCWAKADALPQLEPNGLSRLFGIKVTVDYYMNEDNQVADEVFFFPGNPCIHGWQYISGSVIPAHNFDFSIVVELLYANNCNSVYFAGSSLVESVGIVYKYDSRGNLIESDKSGMSASTYTYDANDRPTGIIKPYVNTSITYADPVNGRQPATVTTADVTTAYTYDSAGNVIGTVIRPEGNANAKSLSSSTTFNTTSCKLTASTDVLGTVTSYTYYSDGVLRSTATGGTSTEYTYDRYGNVAKAWMDDQATVQYTYTGLDLTGITTGADGSTVEYTFTYDEFGRTTSVSAGETALASYTYGSLGELRKVEYGNVGYPLLTVEYFYDKLLRVVKVRYNGNDRFLYDYDGMGNLQYFTDCTANVKYVYEYTEQGALLFEEQYSTVSPYSYLQGRYYTYNEYGDLKTAATVIPGVDTKRETFSYKYEDETATGDLTAISGVEYEGLEYSAKKNYDELNRPSSDVVRNSSGTAVLSRTYTYRNGAAQNTTTPFVSSVQYAGENTAGFSYNYDAYGNVTHVYSGNLVWNSYEYDALGQLVRENNTASNRTYVYEYDARGNITERRTYLLQRSTPTEDLTNPLSTDSYTYMTSSDGMWKDVLKSYNSSSAFTYDDIGNPMSYNNGSSYSFTWTDGRKLAGGTKGNKTFSYTYNADGLRTKKIYDGGTYKYYWSGSSLESMTVTKSGATYVFSFYYDAAGAPYAVKVYDPMIDVWRTYLYVTNLQGDIVRVIDPASHATAVSYEYDAWGRVITKSSAYSDYAALYLYNPLTYRGYIYDEETGFYYLQTRYYDPTVGRFINADGYVSTGTGLLGYNMYAYCNNNPVNCVDPSGCVWWSVFAIVVIVVVVALIVACVISDINTKENEENYKSIDTEIKEEYSKNDAVAEINEILSGYGDDLSIEFMDNSVQIKNSYKVNSKYDRQKICSIIERTNITQRTAHNMSAEWSAHNDATVLPIFYESAHSVDLDYTEDNRWLVRFATSVYEVLGWE